MDHSTLEQLEELARRLGIAVRYETIGGEESPGTGGLCRVKGSPLVIIHSQAPDREKIRILLEALRQFEIGNLYVKPAIRELLEGREE